MLLSEDRRNACDGLCEMVCIAGAVLDAEYSENKSDGLDGPKEEIDEDEAAEILEAMLGLAPNVEPPKKKHRKSEKASLKHCLRFSLT